MFQHHRLDDAADPAGDAAPTGFGEAQGSIEAEYERIIAEQLARMGTEGLTTLEVSYAGDAHDGLGIYRAMIRVVRWDRKSVIRLLLGLPVLQYKLTQVLAASWLPEVSHFGGVWLHPAGELQDRNHIADLRRTIVELESPYGKPSNSRIGESLWSVGPEPDSTEQSNLG